MPLLDYDLENVVPPCVVEEGEVKLRIVGVEEGTSQKTGDPYLRVRLEPFEVIGAKEISHIMMLPGADTSERDRNTRLHRINELKEALGTTSNNTDDWVGEEIWALVGVKSSDEYGDQNNVKRFIITR